MVKTKMYQFVDKYNFDETTKKATCNSAINQVNEFLADIKSLNVVIKTIPFVTSSDDGDLVYIFVEVDGDMDGV